MKKWIYSPSDLKMLNDIIKKYTTDRLVVLVSPGSIRNNGENVPALEVLVGDNKAHQQYYNIYRGLASNFERWLREHLDNIANTEKRPPKPLIIDPKSL